MEVQSGKDKSRIQYKRNGYLGNIGIVKSYLNHINESHLEHEEYLQLCKIKHSLRELEYLLRKNKGSKIEIVKIK